MEGSPSKKPEPCRWDEKEGPKQEDFSKPKRAKETSNPKVCPLTTADIPDIVGAVANANHRKRPAQVRTSRHTLRSGNRTSQDDPPSVDAQPSSEEEDEEYKDVGMCNRTARCTLY